MSVCRATATGHALPQVHVVLALVALLGEVVLAAAKEPKVVVETTAHGNILG